MWKELKHNLHSILVSWERCSPSSSVVSFDGHSLSVVRLSSIFYDVHIFTLICLINFQTYVFFDTILHSINFNKTSISQFHHFNLFLNVSHVSVRRIRLRLINRIENRRFYRIKNSNLCKEYLMNWRQYIHVQRAMPKWNDDYNPISLGCWFLNLLITWKCDRKFARNPSFCFLLLSPIDFM